MSKKILSVFVLLLILSFTTKAFASLTFTSNAITGTGASSIDLGTGNTLSLQTTTNAPINLGSGLLTSTGSATFSGTVKSLNIYEDSTNIAVGSTVLKSNTTGSYNTALGQQSLFSNQAGSFNTAIGYNSMYYNTTNIDTEMSGDSNTAVGFQSLLVNTRGAYNVANGFVSLSSNTTGSDNTALGSDSLPYLVNGRGNTAVGRYAGGNLNTTPVISGNYNTFIGYNTGFALSPSAQRTNSTAIGYLAKVDADNTVVLGNTAVTAVLAGSTALAKVKAGSVQYTTGAKPTCDASSRGTTWYVAGGTGAKDTFEVCGKDGADAYAWRLLY